MLGSHTISGTVKNLHYWAQVCHIRRTPRSASLCNSQSLGVQKLHVRRSPMGHGSKRQPNIWLSGGFFAHLFLAWGSNVGGKKELYGCLSCMFLGIAAIQTRLRSILWSAWYPTHPLSDSGVGKWCKPPPLQSLYNQYDTTACCEFHHGVCGTR